MHIHPYIHSQHHPTASLYSNPQEEKVQYITLRQYIQHVPCLNARVHLCSCVAYIPSYAQILKNSEKCRRPRYIRYEYHFGCLWNFRLRSMILIYLFSQLEVRCFPCLQLKLLHDFIISTSVKIVLHKIILIETVDMKNCSLGKSY